MAGLAFAGQLALLAAAVLGGLIILTSLQRQLIYFPEVAEESRLLAEAQRLGMQPWRAADGALIGWLPAAQGNVQRRLLIFHGNAGYALQRHYFVAGFASPDSGWEVRLFEYPGYGARPGTPSESDIKAAALEAVEQMLGEDSRPLYLLGESLGSGVAAWLAGTLPQRIAGLLLVTPFTRLPDVAAHHYPFLPVRVLLRERYDSVAALAAYDGPVAFLLAGEDEVVPVDLGRQLYALYGGPKWLKVVPGAGHNTLPLHPGAAWWSEVSGFLTAGAPPP